MKVVLRRLPLTVRLACGSILGLILSVLPVSSSADALPVAHCRIVTSTSDLASLVKEIGGDRVDVKYLEDGTQDPHLATDHASSLVNLHRADLLMVIGLQMESAWLGEGLSQFSLLAECANPHIQFGSRGYFDLSRYVEVLDIPNEITRALGIHPLGNPHYWLDPENGRRIARAIATKLGTELPSNSSYFQQRLMTFEAQLTTRERVWDEKLRPYRRYKVITYHRAWTNFLAHFGLLSVGEIEPFPGIPPDHKHVSELIREMQRQNVRLILVEPFYGTETADKIARETGAKVVILPGSVLRGRPAADYLSLFDCEVDSLTRAFQSHVD